MSENQVKEINRSLAREFIESRLDAHTSEANIQKLVNCIQEIEA